MKKHHSVYERFHANNLAPLRDLAEGEVMRVDRPPKELFDEGPLYFIRAEGGAIVALDGSMAWSPFEGGNRPEPSELWMGYKVPPGTTLELVVGGGVLEEREIEEEDDDIEYDGDVTVWPRDFRNA